jgi:glutamate-1-semialdehyde aminotransferase
VAFGGASELYEITPDLTTLGKIIGGVSAPAVRQLKVTGAVLAPIGKPTTVFTADDAASKHRFELEVTPTRAR